MNFIDNPTFPPPNELAWSKEQFVELCYKVRAYMKLINPSCSNIIRMVDENLLQSCDTRIYMKYSHHKHMTV